MSEYGFDRSITQLDPRLHPVFSDPNGNFGATNFGQITGTKVVARQMMFGLKYHF